MSFNMELEKGEFTRFLKTFEEAFHHPKPKEEAKELENHIAQGIQKFQALLVEETKKRVAEGVQGFGTYAKVARENPLLMYFCAKNYWREEGFAIHKALNPEMKEELDAVSASKNFFDSMLGNYTSKLHLSFVVYPEVRHHHEFVFKFLKNDIGFEALWRYHQVCKLQKPGNLSEKESQTWDVLYRFELSPDLWPLPQVLPLNFAAVKARFEAALQEIRPYSPQVERKLVVELFKNFTLDNDVVYSINCSKCLHFMLNQNLDPQTMEGWHELFPWESLRSHHLFVLDHLENDPPKKQKVLAFFEDKIPNLVKHHLLLGQFFIAEQLMDYGLKEPKLELVPFVTEAIELGLTRSRELKKYHAMLLLMVHLGIVDKKELQRLEKLLMPKEGKEKEEATLNVEAITKIVQDNLGKLLQYYVKLHEEPMFQQESMNPKRGRYKSLCRFMLAIELDYAIALSTLYHLPMINSVQTTRLSRGISIPKSRLNEGYVRSWFQYGVRASTTTYFTHGYNHGVEYGMEEGPIMSWALHSDTTRVTPILVSGYARTSQHFMGYWMTLRYQEGQPVFLGNLCLIPEKMPNELELPFCAPENVEAIYQMEHLSDNVCSVSYAPETPIERQALFLGERTDLPRNREIADTFQKQFRANLKPYNSHFSTSFADYIKQYNVAQLVRRFNEHYKTFSKMADRSVGRTLIFQRDKVFEKDKAVQRTTKNLLRLQPLKL